MKYKLIIALLLVNLTLSAQSIDQKKIASVEKNMYEVQLGLLNLSFQYETKLERKLALHTEAGILINTYSNFSNDPSVRGQTEYISAPYFSIEPRFYYGLDRRARLNRNIAHNSSNYFSLKTSYRANNWQISNSNDKERIVPALAIVPSFGIRRSFAKNFNYEFSFGVGYRSNIIGKEGCNCPQGDTEVDIQTKIGYNF